FLLILLSVAPSACSRLSGTPKSSPAQAGTHEVTFTATVTLVKDINPSGDGPSVGFMGLNPPVKMGNAIYFASDDGTHGTELWRSDGTLEGTWLVKDIATGVASSNPSAFVVSGSWLYFAADDGATGGELWRSDGTTAGTVQVKDIWPGATGSAPRALFASGGLIHFFAASDTGGLEPWRSDGTAAGTIQLVDVNPGAADCEAGTWGMAGGLTYFSASDGFTGGLWKTDSTAPGTQLLHDFQSFGISQIGSFADLAGKLYFGAKDSAGTELWNSDGSEAGTALVKDIFPGANSAYPGDLTVFNGMLFFGGRSSLNRNFLWKSDGTLSGTLSVVEGASDALAVSGSLLYFRLNGEPGISDGTSAGTRLLKEIHPTEASLAYPPLFTTLGEWTYFAANDGIHGRELWRTNGTAEGTGRVAGVTLPSYTFLIPLGTRLLVLGSDPAAGQELLLVQP
ncbi:MAG: hypothetical protein NDJ90_07490, partial [Oligoflexia bacterium]|nr:hypothetical protein [Oligoflexia bacterium]